MIALADTGYFVGLFNPKDHHHQRCAAFMKRYGGQLLTTWAVFTEVCAILPFSRQKAFFDWAAQAEQHGHLRIESPPQDAVAALWRLLDRYDDLPMDFCDASLVYLATQLKIKHIATTDARDFSVYRLAGKQRFVHVLES